MADGKIDKSLDDIIKERKISGRAPRANGAKPGGARGAGRGGFRRGTSSNAAANRSFGRRPNGGVQKRRSAGGSPLKGSVCVQFPQQQRPAFMQRLKLFFLEYKRSMGS